jgi:hypothetical protein
MKDETTSTGFFMVLLTRQSIGIALVAGLAAACVPIAAAAIARIAGTAKGKHLPPLPMAQSVSVSGFRPYTSATTKHS